MLTDISWQDLLVYNSLFLERQIVLVTILFEQNLENKKICDVGCGTGILSIIAEKIGASEIDAVDIINNCIEI